MFPVYVALSFLYVVFRVGSFTNIAERVTDTPGYERVASLPLWSVRFYESERGFTVPLLYKVFSTGEGRIVAQLVISTAAWLVFAAVVSRRLEDRRVRVVAFAVVLAFSLTTEIILWDTLLLSESLTLAITALLLAAWFLLVSDPRPRWIPAVLVLSVLWAFARDSNAYVILLIAILVAVGLVRPGNRRILAALVGGLCLIFVAAQASADAGKRWRQPFVDVLVHRVIPDPTARDYFATHGLDLSQNWIVSSWVDREGRGVYTRYLASHPGYVLFSPFHGRQEALYSTPRNIESLLDPSVRLYDDNAGKRFLPLPRPFERALFPRGVLVVLLYLTVGLLVAACVAFFAGARATWLVPFGLLATTYPHLLVAWHFSGVEVDRHALEAAVLFRLAILLLVALAADRFVSASRDAPRSGR